MSDAEFQQRRRAAIAVPAPSTPDALEKWCWNQMFLRYGARVSGQPRTLELEADNAHRIKDTCVRTKGRAI